MTTTSLSDRWTSHPDDLRITPLETRAQRVAAFLEPFAVGAEGGIVYDRSGHPFAVTPSSVDGLERYSAAEIRRAAQALASPTEIRRLWTVARDGSKLWTRRYLATIDGVEVAVDVDRTGWRFATDEDPGFDRDALRGGELAWSQAAA